MPASGGFSAVAEAPDAFVVSAAAGAGFVDAAGFLAKLDEGPLVQSPALMKGLDKEAPGPVRGAFPDGLWMQTKKTLKWVNGVWADTQLLRDGEELLDVAAWDDKRAVAAIAMPHNDMRFFLVGGKPGVVVPSPARAAKPEKQDAPAIGSAEPAASAAPEGDAPPDDACKVKMKPSRVALAGLPSGHLFAAGFECDESGHGALIAERWEPKKQRGTIEPLPKGESDASIGGVLAIAPDEAYVFGGSGGKSYLAKWDGKTWTSDAAPAGVAILQMARADDGSVWAVTTGDSGSSLWKKPSGGAFVAASLPAGARATAVYPRTPFDVWVAAKTVAGTGVLLRTGAPPKAVVKLPSRKEMQDTLATNRRFLATSICDKVFAHLATISPSQNGTAPVPKDFTPYKELFTSPEFASLAPIVEDDGASYYVGAPVPNLEVGEKLALAYKEKNPKAAPRLFCHEPVIVKKAIKFE